MLLCRRKSKFSRKWDNECSKQTRGSKSMRDRCNSERTSSSKRKNKYRSIRNCYIRGCTSSDEVDKSSSKIWLWPLHMRWPSEIHRIRKKSTHFWIPWDLAILSQLMVTKHSRHVALTQSLEMMTERERCLRLRNGLCKCNKLKTSWLNEQGPYSYERMRSNCVNRGCWTEREVYLQVRTSWHVEVSLMKWSPELNLDPSLLRNEICLTREWSRKEGLIRMKWSSWSDNLRLSTKITLSESVSLKISGLIDTTSCHERTKRHRKNLMKRGDSWCMRQTKG